MTRDDAMREYRSLVSRHGLRWTATVPAEAWARLLAVNAVLTESDRREALGLPR